MTETHPEPNGILNADTLFAYVQTQDSMRIYAEDATDTQWVQSDTTVGVIQ